jgi:N,N-dimethylformamidase
VYFTTKGGGAVFSTGSIAWASALPVNQFDNTVSRITANVVDAFVGRETLPE